MNTTITDVLRTDSPAPASPLAQATNEDVDLILGNVTEMRQYLKREFPRIKSRACVWLAEFFVRTANADRCLDILRDSNRAWVDWVSAMKEYPGIARVYEGCKRCGDAVRQMRRVDEADRRALDGWNEPVFYQGQRVSTIRKYSDRLLELQLRAGDPETYADRSTVETTSKTVSFHFHFDRTTAADDLAKHRAKRQESGA